MPSKYQKQASPKSLTEVFLLLLLWWWWWCGLGTSLKLDKPLDNNCNLSLTSPSPSSGGWVEPALTARALPTKDQPQLRGCSGSDPPISKVQRSQGHETLVIRIEIWRYMMNYGNVWGIHQLYPSFIIEKCKYYNPLQEVQMNIQTSGILWAML